MVRDCLRNRDVQSHPDRPLPSRNRDADADRPRAAVDGANVFSDIVEHQEGLNIRVLFVKEQRIDVKTVADPMRRRCFLNMCDFSYLPQPQSLGQIVRTSVRACA